MAFSSLPLWLLALFFGELHKGLELPQQVPGLRRACLPGFLCSFDSCCQSADCVGKMLKGMEDIPFFDTVLWNFSPWEICLIYIYF